MRTSDTFLVPYMTDNRVTWAQSNITIEDNEFLLYVNPIL